MHAGTPSKLQRRQRAGLALRMERCSSPINLQQFSVGAVERTSARAWRVVVNRLLVVVRFILRSDNSQVTPW